LQSKDFLIHSLRVIILGLKWSFHSIDSLDGIIFHFTVDVFFRCSLNSCVDKLTCISKDMLEIEVVDKLICISKDMLEIEVHAYNFIEHNDFHVPYPLHKPPFFFNLSFLLIPWGFNFLYQGLMRKRDEWKECEHKSFGFVLFCFIWLFMSLFCLV
jgi:hypothetical protein